MKNFIWPLPIKGFNQGVNVENTPPDTTNDLNNVRPLDSLANRIRLGQRPGLNKAYDEQIGGATSPIIEIGSVTVVDYIGEDA